MMGAIGFLLLYPYSFSSNDSLCLNVLQAKENIEKREKLELDRNKLEYESRQVNQ